jgi:hypothetical protein
VIIMTGLRQKASSPSSLRYIYRVLVLHGVVLKRETGADALALGLRPDGKKEVIDFRLTSAESAQPSGSSSSVIWRVAA